MRTVKNHSLERDPFKKARLAYRDRNGIHVVELSLLAGERKSMSFVSTISPSSSPTTAGLGHYVGLQSLSRQGPKSAISSLRTKYPITLNTLF